MDTNPMDHILGASRATLVIVDADRLAEALAERLGAASSREGTDEWLDVSAAAKHLRCPTSRIHDLKAAGRLRFAKDGARLLFRREWLDEATQVEPEPGS